MFKEIELLINDKDFHKALTLLLEIDDNRKQMDRYLKLLAHVYFRCEKYILAKKNYELIFSNKIEDTRAYLEYCSILSENNENRKAKEYLFKGFEKFPQSIPILRTLITKIKKDENLDLEYNLCAKLLTLDSENSISYKLIIDVLLRKKSYQMAESEIREAILKFGENKFLLESIKYYIAVLEYEKALEAYNKLEKLTPTNYVVYVGQIRMLDILGRFEESEPYLLRGLNMVEEKYKNKILELLINFYKKLSNIYNKKNDLKNSLNILDLAEQMIITHDLDKINLFIIHIEKAKLYQKIQNWTLSLKVLDAALQIKPTSTEAKFLLGISKLNLYDFSEAKNIFNDILKLDPNHKKAKTYLIALDREKGKFKNKMKRYKELSKKIPKNYFDHLVYIDFKIEFGYVKEAIKISQNRLDKSPNEVAILTRLIISLLEDYKFLDAIQYWKYLLARNYLDSDLLYLINSSQKSTLINEDIYKLHIKTSNLLKHKITKNAPRVKKIAILGGSNSIMTDGWTPEFQKNMLNFSNIEVNNYGLGGISSLYGLYIAKEKELFKSYDMIIFEYTLNDIYFDYSQGYDHKLLSSVLRELIFEATKNNCTIVFMLMSPLDNLTNLIKDSCPITIIYKDIIGKSKNAYLFDIYRVIEPSRYSSQTFIDMQYRDNMHYTSIFAKYIANIFYSNIVSEHLLTKKKVHKIEDIDKDKSPLSDLKLLKPQEYDIRGKFHYVLRESKIISRKFLCIGKDTSIRIKIPKGKRILALLINSSENTGYLKVEFGKNIFIKNIFAERPINDPNKARIYLKQFTKILINNEKDCYLKISTGLDENDISNLEEDITVYPQIPKIASSEQELEIAGILIA